MRTSRVLPVTILAAAAALAAGCSSPSFEGDPLPMGGSSSKRARKDKTSTEADGTDALEEAPGGGPTPEAPASDGGAEAGSADAGASPPPAGACASTTTGEACFTCCEQRHPQGIAFLQQAFGQCACGDGAGSCSAECAGSFCAGRAPSPACDACLDASDACRLQADAACEQNAACNAMFQCDAASQCASKP